QTGPGQAIVGELAPGQPPRLVRLDGGGEQVLCSSPPALAAFDPAVSVSPRLAISGHTAHLAIGDRELTCSIGTTGRGAWGIASLGAGAQVAVDTITVAR